MLNAKEIKDYKYFLYVFSNINIFVFMFKIKDVL